MRQVQSKFLLKKPHTKMQLRSGNDNDNEHKQNGFGGELMRQVKCNRILREDKQINSHTCLLLGKAMMSQMQK